MFMVGFDIDTRAYFTFPTSIIAIPTGIKILNWLATIWSSRFSSITPLYLIIGFLFSFSFEGFTGLISANSIIDIILHDSYFIIGHSHYVLSLGAVYSIFGSFYTYWIFLINYSILDYLGKIQFILFSMSSNLIFFSMHSLGIIGFPRRIFDYSIIYYRFHWLNSFGLIGVCLSVILFYFVILIILYIILV